MQNSSARSAVDVGSVIAGTYTIEALIGRGGMGAVFLASHNRLPGKKVAIKMLHAEITDEETLARFRREAQIASLLGHPNIVHVEDFDVMPDGTPYLVLEYLQGETIAQRLQHGPIPVEQILSIVRQVGSALAAAHRAGVVHRDLKPQNIFLVPTEVDGRSFELAKVLDFGISKMRGSQTVKTQESALLGTPQYMAPEQATGKHDSVDERTDIFAFGAIVYEMLAGHPAFDGANIPEVVFKVVYEQPRPLADTVSPTIAKAVQQALSKPSADRFASVNEFVEAVTGQPLPAARPASLPPPDSSAPTGRAKSTGKEAFDQTIGSGDHSASIASSATASVPPTAPPVPPTAETVASQTALPKPPRRTLPLVAVSLLGLAALAAVIYFVALRHDEPPPAPAPAPVAQAPSPSPPPSPPPSPSPSPSPSPPPSPSPSPSPSPAPPPHVTAKPPTPPTPTPPPPTAKAPSASDSEPDTEKSRDETSFQHVQDAEAAIKSKDWTRAKKLANSVINREESGPGQRAHAYCLVGIIACAANNDQETAGEALRHLDGYPKFKRRLIGTCRDAGITIGQ